MKFFGSSRKERRAGVASSHAAALAVVLTAAAALAVHPCQAYAGTTDPIEPDTKNENAIVDDMTDEVSDVEVSIPEDTEEESAATEETQDSNVTENNEVANEKSSEKNEDSGGDTALDGGDTGGQSPGDDSTEANGEDMPTESPEEISSTDIAEKTTEESSNSEGSSAIEATDSFENQVSSPVKRSIRASAEITTAATNTYTIDFYHGFSTVEGFTKSETRFTPDQVYKNASDPIFDENGNKVTGITYGPDSAILSNLTDTELHYYKRYGYLLSGFDAVYYQNSSRGKAGYMVTHYSIEPGKTTSISTILTNTDRYTYSDITIYCYWTYQPSATLAFYDISNNIAATQGDVHWDTPITTVPTVNDENFDAWYDQVECQQINNTQTYEKKSSSATPIVNKVTFGSLYLNILGGSVSNVYLDSVQTGASTGRNIHACVGQKSYTIVYRANSNDSKGVFTETADASTVAKTSDALSITNTGHEFAGWTITESTGASFVSGGNTVNSTIITKSDLEAAGGAILGNYFTASNNAIYYFTAIWNEIPYTVTWYGKYGSVNKSAPQYATWTQGISVPNSVSTDDYTYNNELYKFKGWYFKVNGTDWVSATASESDKATLNTQLGDSSLNAYRNDSTHKLDVYGIWEIQTQTFTITYNHNYTGSSDTTKPVLYKNGVNTDTGHNTVTYETPTRTGYTFGGWATSASSKTKAYDGGATISGIHANTTLYAIWTGNTIAITYYVNADDDSVTVTPYGGTATTSNSTVTGDSATIGTAKTLAAATRDGYTFVGWADASDASTGFTSWTPDADTGSTKSLYAVWTQKHYTIQFNPNGGKINSSTSNYTATGTYTWKDAIANALTEVSGKTKACDNYTWAGWATTSGATSANVDASRFTQVKDFKGLISSDNKITIYAVWKGAEVTITYTTADATKGGINSASAGSVTQTVNLATGKLADGSKFDNVTGAPATDYEFKDWTTADSAATQQSTSASWHPTITSLRTAYNSNGTTTFAYRANFKDKLYGFSVEMYAQNADGSYTKAYTVNTFGTDFEATYGTVVKAEDLVNGVSTNPTYKQLFLNYKTDSVSNDVLYKYVVVAGSREQIDKISRTSDNNVLKLYYDRKTFDLTATDWTTKPTAVTDSISDYLPRPTTGIRWGSKVTLGAPSSTGYDYAWKVTTPSGVAVSDNAFTISAANYKALADANTTTVVVAGDWTKKKFFLTLTNPSSLVDAAAGLTLPNPAKKEIAYEETAGTWVPQATDNTSYKYFFAGWKNTTTGGETKSTAELRTLAITSDQTWEATWAEKIVIIYNPGVANKASTSIADWATQTYRLGSDDISASTIGGYTKGNTHPAKFHGGTGTDNTVPTHIAGWTFAGWKVTYVGTPASGGTASVTADDTTRSQETVDGIYLKQSITFQAIWTAVPQTVTYGTTGYVRQNNAANTDTITVTYTNGTKATVYTDDAVNLTPAMTFTSKQAGNAASDGYTFVGWNTKPNGTGTYYVTTARLNMPGTGLTLYPVFDEKAVTVSYQVAQSGLTGAISPTTSDTVYAVTHNGATAHTASVGTPAGYQFDGWTKGAAKTATNAYLTTADGIDATDVAKLTPVFAANTVLTAGETYYANFSTKTFTVKVSNPTGNHGTVSVATTYSNNEIPVIYNTSVTSAQISAITPKAGYELTGWTIADATTGTKITTLSGNTANAAGLYTYKVMKNVKATPIFTVKTAADYTINYNFNDGAHTGGTSRNVAWDKPVLPTGADAAPTKAGYTFAGWFATSDFQAASETTADKTFEWLNTNHYATLTDAGAHGTATLYAKWTENTSYAVHYDINGNYAADAAYTGDQATVSSGSAADLANVAWTNTFGPSNATPAPTFTLPTVTRTGYEFKGWSVTATKDGVSRTTYVAATPYEGTSAVTYGALAGNQEADSVTLSAVWDEIVLTVVYVYADGSRNNYSRTDVKWATPTNFYNDPQTSSAPARTNYAFKGWTVSWTGGSSANDVKAPTANQTVAQLTGGVLPSDRTIKLTANWNQQMTYIYQDILVDSTGHETVGWTSTGIGGGEDGQVISFTITGSVTAGWTGSNDDYGTTDTDPHKHTGYVFDGSKTSSSYTLLATDTEHVYKIYYKVKTYTVAYYDANAYAKDGTLSELAGVTRRTVAYDSTDFAANAAEVAAKTPAGYSGYTWQYLPARSTTLADVASGTKLGSLLGTNDSPAGPVALFVKYKPVKATIRFAGYDASLGSITPAGDVTVDAPHVSTDAAATAVPARTATANSTSRFTGWYYLTDSSKFASYTTADLLPLAPGANTYATLTDADGDGLYETLQPLQWAASSTDATAIWHDILFVARFVDASGTTVSVRHYFEDANGTPDASSYAWKSYEETTPAAENNATFDATTQALSRDGYTLTSITGLTDASHMVDKSDPSTLIFKLYYLAATHNVAYSYTNPDKTPTSVSQTLPAGADYKVGKTVTVAPVTLDNGGNWTLEGWAATYTKNGTTYDLAVTTDPVTGVSTFAMPDGDVKLTGTWKRVEYQVFFKSDSNAPAGCVLAAPDAGYTVGRGDTLASTLSKTQVSQLDGLTITIPKATGTDGSTYDAYYISGWKAVWTDASGRQQSESLTGLDAPMTYKSGSGITATVTFYPVWSPIFVVSYVPGTHGDWTGQTTTGLQSGSTTPAPPATTTGKPGWEFAGWGWKDGSGWKYTFDYNANVDYTTDGGVAPTAAYTGETIPGTVTSSVDYYAFYIRSARTVVFLNKAQGDTTSDKAGTWDASHLATDITIGSATYQAWSDATARTGAPVTLPDGSAITLANYTLQGWTDGTNTYPLGTGVTTIPMPGQTASTLYLYPVWKMDGIVISYEVETGQKAPAVTTGDWGQLDRYGDNKATETDTISGSTPTANPGYEFAYWYKKGDLNKTPITDTAIYDATTHKLTPQGVIASAGTYVAVFKQKTYAFTLDDGVADGDANPVTLPGTTNFSGVWTDTLTPGVPTRDGYTFAGWEAQDADGNKVAEIGAADAANSVSVSKMTDAAGATTAVKLVAKWDANTSVITYELPSDKGASWSDGTAGITKTDNTHKTGEPAALLDADSVRRPGYVLAGWSEDPAATTGTFSLAAAPANGVTLHPVWKPAVLTVVFHDENPSGVAGATVSGMPDEAETKSINDALVWDKTAGVPAGKPTVDGYKFLGWAYGNDTNKNKGTYDGTKLFKNMVDSDTDYTLDVYAVWEPYTYRVIYADGEATTGSASLPETRTATWESTDLLPATTPTKDGYTFIGWQYGKDGTMADYANQPLHEVAGAEGLTAADFVGATTDTDDKGIKFYAAWKKNAIFQVIVKKDGSNEAVPTDWPASTFTGVDGQEVTVAVAADGTVTILGTKVGVNDGQYMTADAGHKLPTPAGWEYSATAAAKSSLAPYTLKADETLHVFTLYLTPKTGYAVEYYDQDGTKVFTRNADVNWNTDNLDKQDATNAAAIAAPTGHEGEKFLGWYTAKTAGTKLESNLTYEDLVLAQAGSYDDMHKPVKLYAQWAPRLYAVEWVDATDVADALGEVVIKHDATLGWKSLVSVDEPEKLAGYVKDGYVFKGWELRATAGADPTPVTDNTYKSLATRLGYTDAQDAESGTVLKIYAKWAKYVGYTVEYYTTEDGTTLTKIKGADKTHTPEEHLALEGESYTSTQADDFTSDQRPAGYKFDADASTLMVGTPVRDAASNVVKVVFNKIRDYKVILDANKGTDDAQTEVTGLTWDDKSAYDKATAEPTRMGHTLHAKPTRWNTKADGTGAWLSADLTYGELAKLIDASADDLALETKGITLYAQYDVNSDYAVDYSLNYDDKGVDQTLVPDNAAAKQAAYLTDKRREDVSWPDSGFVPSDTSDIEAPRGYELAGWFYKAADGTRVDIDANTTYEAIATATGAEAAGEKSVRLYAKWVEQLVAIAYETADAATGIVTRAVDYITAVTGKPATSLGTSSAGTAFTSVAQAKPGYHFVKWSLKDASSDATLTAAAAVGGLNTTTDEALASLQISKGTDGLYHAATYVASFEANPDATLAYDLNGGTGQIADVVKPNGSLLTLSDGTGATRDYYELTGWNTKADGTGTAYKLGETDVVLPEDGLTLFAQWTLKRYTATIPASTGEGGSVSGTTAVVTYGENLPEGTGAAANPVPATGKRLAGWTYTMVDDVTGEVTTGTVSDPSDLKILGDVTFEPVWEDDPNYVAPSAATTTKSATGTAGAREGIPQTGDPFVAAPLALTASGLFFLLLAALVSRRARTLADDRLHNHGSDGMGDAS